MNDNTNYDCFLFRERKFICRVAKCFSMSENSSERRNVNDFMICVDALKRII